MAAPTFYHRQAGPDPVGRTLKLADEEARHVRSLRLRPGDEVRVTDGAGGLWRARLETSGDGARCVPLERLDAPPPLPVQVAFGVAAKDRTLLLVEKAVELGALSLQPVEFRRSRSVADAGRSAAFWRKAGRRAVAALKQCGGARLPEIAPVRDLHEFLGRARRPAPEGAAQEEGPDVVLHRSGSRRLGEALADWDGRRTLRVLLGPEGGLEDDELRACREAGFAAASLGPRVLRFETAAVAALAVAADRRPTTDEESADA